jgi:hypothetical protein
MLHEHGQASSYQYSLLFGIDNHAVPLPRYAGGEVIELFFVEAFHFISLTSF